MKHIWVLGIKFTHNHWKEIWLLVNQCVGTKGHKKLLKLFTEKTKRKTRLKQGQNWQGEKKGHLWSQLYQLWKGDSRIHTNSAVFKGVYSLCVTQTFLSKIQKCILGQITFQMSKFFTQKKISGMYCAE